MSDLSIVIPSRNEEFLLNTVNDILSNIEGDTEIIVVLDGCWPVEPLPQHPRVVVVHLPESIGQRAAMNVGARISKSKYIMKCDAHCSFGKGFDRILMEDMKDEYTMVPKMYNLHVFDWVCEDGHRRYQSPSGNCHVCGKETKKEIMWIAKPSPETTSMRFDRDLKFQYWGEFKKQQDGDLVETMSILGACFMLTREKYFELNIADEGHGGWGQQGTEVACKTWLSGGKLMCNKRTWFAHLFRTQGGDFGFPYPITNAEQEKARKYSRDLWLNNKWDKAKYPLKWIIDKFDPPGWKEPSKEIVYYTCNTHKPEIDEACRKQLLKCGVPITSVSLNKELDFGENQITVLGEKSPLMLHRQVLEGLKKSNADIIFLCESDVYYHPSHFEFTPKRNDVFYFNTNVWKVRYDDGHAIWTDDLEQLSGMVAYKDLLIEFFTKRIEQIEKEGFNKHYEPSARQNVFPKERGGKYGQEDYQSAVPNICIRHDQNITKSKWSVEEFKNKEFAKGWKEADEIPSWGKFKEFFNG